MNPAVTVQFWGTRGSLPRPGPKTARYGGNTSCVLVTAPDGTKVVIDCGSGAFELGRKLKADPGGPLHGSLLISHTHWDHIQGFPFFAPLFDRKWSWDIYGPAGLGTSLREALAGQMQYSYFPVTLNDLGAKIHFHDLVEGEFRIGNILVNTLFLNHTVLTLGYRLEIDGVVVVYLCDHEPFGWSGIAGEPLHELDQRHCEFMKGADLVIHDAQFTDEEYATRRGWGHSPVGYVIHLSRMAGARRVALTHHDLGRTDSEIDTILESLPRDSGMEIFAAADGQIVEMEADHNAPKQMARGFRTGVPEPVPALQHSSVLIGVSDEETASRLSAAASAGNVRILHANDGPTLLQMARSDPPTLLVIEHEPGKLDGLAVCRSLMAEEDPRLSGLPKIVVADREVPGLAGDLGITRWLIRPFSTPYARAHIQAALMRSVCRWVSAPIPPDEAGRLETLQALSILDTPFEERFDRITRIAATLAEVPIALVSLVDLERQWFKSCVGLDISETSRELAFCAHVVFNRKVMVVKDTLLDERFADSPVVVGGPRIRFYAGFPVFHKNGSCLGTLCLIDTRPRELSENTLGMLRDLANIVEEELNAGAKKSPE